MDIIATIGPQLSPNRIKAIVDAGATILRINGAHATSEAAAALIREIRGNNGDRARIMIDLPTNKIRTQNIAEPIAFVAGERLHLHPFQLNFPGLCDIVREGDEVIVNDGFNHLFVQGVKDGVIEFAAESQGTLGNNRGLIFAREIHTPGFPLFFARDFELIEVINDLNVEYVGLSYLRYPEEKIQARSKIKNANSIIYKVETRVAFDTFATLIEPGDKILLDRGDLAGEIGLIRIPQAQDRLIRWAHEHRVEIYCATQFLSAMIDSPVPQISEVCALYNMLKLGVTGVQLSEETAIGKHPVRAVEWIRSIEKLVIDEEKVHTGPDCR